MKRLLTHTLECIDSQIMEAFSRTTRTSTALYKSLFFDSLDSNFFLLSGIGL
jgi:hypothetical protein